MFAGSIGWVLLFVCLFIILSMALVYFLADRRIRKGAALNGVASWISENFGWLLWPLGMCVIVVFAVWGCIDYFGADDYEIESVCSMQAVYPLEVLQTYHGMSGERTFFYGNLGSDDSYGFLYRQEDGGLCRLSVPADEVVVYELMADSEQRPYIEMFDCALEKYRVYDESKLRWFQPFWRSVRPESRELVTLRLFDVAAGASLADPVRYKVYVPEGSIVSVFDTSFN